MGDQTQAYDIFQTPLSSGYPLPLNIYKMHWCPWVEDLINFSLTMCDASRKEKLLAESLQKVW